ncbi:hypothetical protein C1645_802788 [Glomus cerebriforme]|uniref:Uncharacterized protein n=1 Tax=Glomus cerebriforme TaxID=658196 RepID=A0A397TCW4_9GLOM|nr:hypothetical protein C1645_802788 [Glomus cerebriforme]
MSPIAFDTTLVEQICFEAVEHTNGLTKDPTKSCTDQEQPQQQQPPPQLEQEQKRNDKINIQQLQEEVVTVSTSEDMMQIDDPKELIPSSEQNLDQNSPPQPLQPPQLIQETQQHQVTSSSQIKQTNSENLGPCITNTNDMEDTLLNENEDYEMMLRAVNVLKFQLEQVKEDIKKLKEIKQRALSDPITYIEKLRDGTHGKIPERQYIFGVPQINWNKYHTRPSQYKPPPRPERESRNGFKSNDTSSSDSSLDPAEFVHKKAQELGFKVPPNAVLSTRTKRKTNPVFDDDRVFNNTLPQSMGRNKQGSMPFNKKGKQALFSTPVKKRGAIRNGSASAVSNSSMFSTIVANTNCTSTSTLVSSSNRRNNKKKSSELKLSEDSPKTGNYNIPWTDDEQRRLVELLAIYPDEEIQSHRFKKISEALGTRTPKQVASRVQKYFIKLAKHGLPVPGRIPSVSFATTATKNSQSKNKKSGRASKPKVISPSPEKRPRHLRISGLSYLEERPPPTVYMPDDDDESIIKNEMMLVERPQNDNVQQTYNVITGPVHHGFCCDGCHMDPIIGSRYLCSECDESREVDLCEECFGEECFENEYHKKTHKFILITNPIITPHIDKDYVPENIGEYSYLGVAPPPTS